MTRKKVKLAYITNDSTRKATYKKRMKALKNKMSKLSTRCGSDTCVIMYSPYKSQLEITKAAEQLKKHCKCHILDNGSEDWH
ncbi:hypothetical protein Gotri_001228 [Gossypium trilobum]|uniref:MADS-box domain-containing protein n=1 Tax=Gossypium trilobum TaxID=34281 RepID=A0A7J9FEC3_9ROSI|nr:hypothetical protein [Gossypium trilobum]